MADSSDDGAADAVEQYRVSTGEAYQHLILEKAAEVLRWCETTAATLDANAAHETPDDWWRMDPDALESGRQWWDRSDTVPEHAANIARYRLAAGRMCAERPEMRDLRMSVQRRLNETGTDIELFLRFWGMVAPFTTMHGDFAEAMGVLGERLGKIEDAMDTHGKFLGQIQAMPGAMAQLCLFDEEAARNTVIAAHTLFAQGLPEHVRAIASAYSAMYYTTFSKLAQFIPESWTERSVFGGLVQNSHTRARALPRAVLSASAPSMFAAQRSSGMWG
jgi:hypothetical protein